MWQSSQEYIRMLILHYIILTMSVLQPKINRHTRKKNDPFWRKNNINRGQCKMTWYWNYQKAATKLTLNEVKKKNNTMRNEKTRNFSRGIQKTKENWVHILELKIIIVKFKNIWLEKWRYTCWTTTMVTTTK